MTTVPAEFDSYAALIWTWTVAFAPRVFAAVLILIAGSLIARWAARLVVKMMGRTGGFDETARPAIAASVRYSVLILTFIAALGQIGVQTASLFAVLGAAGLAIGLALQGTLSNIASGIMLLWLRPFRVGDYIEVVSGNVVSGTVKEIGLFACLLETFDGVFVFAPNSTIWNFALRNHSRTVGRLVSFVVTLGGGANVDRASGALVDMLRGDSHVLKSPSPEVFVDNLPAGAPLLACRFWVGHDDIGEMQRVIVDQARRRLEQAGEKPIQISRTVPPDSDPSRLIAIRR